MDPDVFRNAAIARRALAGIRRAIEEACVRLGRPMRIMEVCGTHTVQIAALGLREALAGLVEFISGPGCPVCVTSPRDLEMLHDIALSPGVTVATFGDMVRVPGRRGSLADLSGMGADVRVVFDPSVAVDLAESEPARLVVLVGVGFETTAPVVAATLARARVRGVDNFAVLSLHKTMPRALERLFAGGCAVDGLILPGHVAAVAGSRAFEDAAELVGVPAAISGFEPLDIMFALFRIAGMIASDRRGVVNAYPRAVTRDGNPHALGLMREVFREAGAEWRGLGFIEMSGLVLREEFSRHDAIERVPCGADATRHAAGAASQGEAARPCRCGDVITGRIRPSQCGSFGAACRPGRPLGPCMVSSEGSCRAEYMLVLDEAGGEAE